MNGMSSNVIRVTLLSFAAHKGIAVPVSLTGVSLVSAIFGIANITATLGITATESASINSKANACRNDCLYSLYMSGISDMSGFHSDKSHPS